MRMTIPDRPARSLAAGLPIRLAALRVLLVEEDGRQRETLLRAIGEMGFDAQAVAGAEGAMRTLAERAAEIIVLGVSGIGGIELFRSIRRAYPRTQVIVVTGGGAEAARMAIRCEAVDMLTRPCALGELEQALDRARSRVGGGRVRRVSPGAGSGAGEDNSLETVERNHILAVLEKNNGNRTATAAELGISLRKLYYRLGQYQREGLL